MRVSGKMQFLFREDYIGINREMIGNESAVYALCYGSVFGNMNSGRTQDEINNIIGLALGIQAVKCADGQKRYDGNKKRCYFAYH